MTPRELVEQISIALAKQEQDLAHALATGLQARDPSALPAIREGLLRRDTALSSCLIWVLGGMPSESATSVLLTTLLDQQAGDAVRWEAAGRLSSRPVHRALTTEELETLRSMLEEGPPAGAAAVAAILANCKGNDPETRAGWVMTRLRREVATEEPTGKRHMGYLSPRVARLTRYLNALGTIGPEGVPVLRAELETAEGEWRTWLQFAMGMSGDEAVAADLRTVITEEDDPYLRWVAVRSYSRACGTKALPLLRELLSDETKVPSNFCGGPPELLLIREVARSEIRRIERTD